MPITIQRGIKVYMHMWQYTDVCMKMVYHNLDITIYSTLLPIYQISGDGIVKFMLWKFVVQ